MHCRRAAAHARDAILLFVMQCLLVSAAGAQSPDVAHPLLVDSTSGAVKVRQAEQWLSPQTGMAIELPAIVSTGADGALKLRQKTTIISIASNTAIELYSGASAGQVLQRVVQNQGSAFYDVAPREDSRLRVETPFLVAVIKGTEFNVTVAPDSASVALFEGLLRVEAPAVGDAVDLIAGQIARRHRDDTNITVIDMEDGEPLARVPPADAGSRDSDRDGNLVSDAGISRDGGIDTGGTRIDIGTGGSAGLGDARVDAGLDADADLGEGQVNLGVDGSADLGDVSVDAGLDTDADLGEGQVNLGVDGSADLGEAGVDAGLAAGADLGSGEVGAEVDIAGISLDLGLDADGGLDDLLDAELTLLDDESDTDDGTTDAGEDEDRTLDLGDLLGL